MLEVRDDIIYSDGNAICNEDELFILMDKAVKYDEIQEDSFLKTELAAQQHENEVVSAFGSYLEDE